MFQQGLVAWHPLLDVSRRLGIKVCKMQNLSGQCTTEYVYLANDWCVDEFSAVWVSSLASVSEIDGLCFSRLLNRAKPGETTHSPVFPCLHSLMRSPFRSARHPPASDFNLADRKIGVIPRCLGSYSDAFQAAT
jgi:hypothetical protein